MTLPEKMAARFRWRRKLSGFRSFFACLTRLVTTGLTARVGRRVVCFRSLIPRLSLQYGGNENPLYEILKPDPRSMGDLREKARGGHTGEGIYFKNIT